MVSNDTRDIVGDVEAIGAHCQYQYCHRLDFLPFACENCKRTFCLDHHKEAAHQCPKAGAWAADRRRNSIEGKKTGADAQIASSTSAYRTTNSASTCSFSSCKSPINDSARHIGVHCPNCNRQYCLKHRLREEHDCAKLVPVGARPAGAVGSSSFNTAAQAEKARMALSRLRPWGKDKPASSSAKSTPPVRSFFTSFRQTMTANAKSGTPAARMVALNELTRKAKGEAKIPTEKRIYLHVEAEPAPTTSGPSPKGTAGGNLSASGSGPHRPSVKAEALFFDAQWSVGRLLDVAARHMQVNNINNRGGTELDRLRIFHVEGGRLLDFGEKVGDVLASGNTVVLLRGVGPPPPPPPSPPPPLSLLAAPTTTTSPASLAST